MMKNTNSIYGGLRDDVLWAKSSPPRALDEHTKDCMLVGTFLKSSLPAVSHLTKWGDKIWDMLAWSLFFHDIGKAASGFQDKLKKGRTYSYRHERLSASVLNQTLSQGMQLFGSDQIEAMVRAVLAHHKSAEKLYAIAQSEQGAFDNADDYLSALTGGNNGSSEFYKQMKSMQWDGFFSEVTACTDDMIPKGFVFGDMRRLVTREVADDVTLYALQEPFEWEKLDVDIFSELILWGLLKNCDHMGSALVKSIPQITGEHGRFLKGIRNPYRHQEECWKTAGSLFLIAPTGSGKTEAAIGWAFQQIEYEGHRHVFYVLPYTASINAMFRRLSRDIDGKDISQETMCFDDGDITGIAHGKLRQALFKYLEDDEFAEVYAGRLAEGMRRIGKPLKVITPFQIIKYMFGVKGFEKELVELAGALLICDEIHAYDRDTFLNMIWSFEWLQRNFGCRFFITTATIPGFLRNFICETLHIENRVMADEKLFADFTRHKVIILPGDMEAQMDNIVQAISKGQKTLIVCNTVNNVQKIYQLVTHLKIIPDNQVKLLHSRFMQRDRERIEKEITDKESTIKVLIGTQAIEVSLDIDYDILFTEPAPLDALLQRFGRVNRRRPTQENPREILKVCICREGGSNDHYIYDVGIVEATLTVLNQVVEQNEGILHEHLLQSMIDKVYPPWDFDDHEIRTKKRDFCDMLDGLLPYREHRWTEEVFENLFASLEVIPYQYFHEYYALIEQKRYIEAEGYICQLHKRANYNPKIRGNLKRIQVGDDKVLFLDCKYDPQTGLLYEPAEHQCELF